MENLFDSRFAPTLVAILSFLLTVDFINCKNKSEDLQPKIWLKSYMQTDGVDIIRADQEFQAFEEFSNDLILKNGSVFTFLSDIKMAYFVCASSFPVQWTLPFPEQFNILDLDMLSLQTSGERQSVFDENMKEPTNQMFYSRLELRLHPGTFISGNFTCEHINNNHTNDKPLVKPIAGSPAGIYVFKEGKYGIQAQGATLNLKVKDEKMTLPCRPALPDMQVSLFKMKSKSDDKNVTVEEEWTELTLNESISFDPMIGFTLNSPNVLVNDIPGLYKCEVNGEIEIFVKINVSRSEVGELTQLDSSFILKQNFTDGKAKVIGRKEYWQCCNGKKNLDMAVSHFDCSNQNDCDLLKPVWMSDYRVLKSKVIHVYEKVNSKQGCIPTDVFFSSQVVICQSAVMDVAVQFVAVYDDEEEIANLNKREPWQSHDLVWTGKSRKHLYDISQPNEPSIKEKVTFRVASPLKNSNFRAMPDSTVVFVLHSPYWESHFENNEEDDAGNGRVVNYLTMHDWEIFEGEDVFLICYSLRFYYAGGGWLRLKWKNGTTTMLTSSVNNEENAVSYMGMSEEIDNAIVSDLIKANLNMSSVECHVPRLTSDKWEMREYQLNIQRPVSPKFTNDQEESITLKLHEGDEEQSINCSVSEGLPQAKIRWEKDGQAVDWTHARNVIIKEDVGTFTVKFLNVSHDLKGSYQCIAENIGGKAVKTFNVHIEGMIEVGIGVEFSSTAFIAVVIVGATVIASLILLIILLIARKIKNK